MDFEWDTAKARVNENKHGVSFFEACEVFDDLPQSAFGPIAVVLLEQGHDIRIQDSIMQSLSVAFALNAPQDFRPRLCEQIHQQRIFRPEHPR